MIVLWKIGFWLWFITRGYYLWSRFWRVVLERKYSGTKLTEYATLGQLESALAAMKWTPDPIKGMFDVISRPEKVEAIYQAAEGDREKATVGDCDEFAVYAATCIQSLIDRGKTKMQKPHVMSINWLDEEGGHHGHNICVFFDPKGKSWAHIGNWFNGKAQYGYISWMALADWMAKSGGDGRVIGYAVATPDLKMVELKLG